MDIHLAPLEKNSSLGVGLVQVDSILGLMN